MDCPRCHSKDTVGTGAVIVRHVVVAGAVTHVIDDARYCNACANAFNVARKPVEPKAEPTKK